MTRAREISNVLGRNIESTTFTATAGQTAFSITHAAGRIQVYMNGLLLDPTVDWTSDGSTVTLTEGAVAGDELEVVKFDNLAVADAIPRTGHTGTIDFSDATFTPPAGHVVQVQSSDLHTVYTASGNGVANVYTNTGLQVNITPTSTSSKVLVNFNVGGIRARLGSFHQEPDLALYRGSTLVQTYSNIIAKGGTNIWIPQLGENASCGNTYLDSPSTTNQVTYAIYIRGNTSYAGDMQVQINGSEYKTTGGGGSSITVMEIAG